LYIIDTTKFAKDIFLRDIDLIKAYESFDDPLERLLERFGHLRRKKHAEYAGYYYFGEYLSQGALKIENKCQTVSALDLISAGLFLLQPELKKSLLQKSVGWANEVIRLREPFYQFHTNRPLMTDREARAANKIAQLFDSGWRLPIAAYFMSLRPRREADSSILLAFSAPDFTGNAALHNAAIMRLIAADEDRCQCSPIQTKVGSTQDLPEVEQFRVLLGSIYTDFSLNKLEGMYSTFARMDVTRLTNFPSPDEIKRAEICLRSAELSALAVKVVDFHEAAWLRTRCQTISGRLDTIMLLTHKVQADVRSSSEGVGL
jgi:hypothetical protein